VQLEWLEQNNYLSQMYSSGLEFCFVNDNKQVCQFVTCKDFLQDAIMAMIHKKSVQIYGFAYDQKKDLPIYLKKTQLAIGNSSDNEFRQKIPCILDFLNKIEKKLRLKPTKATEVSNPKEKYKKGGIFVFDGSAKWQLSPPMLSFYTLAIRIGACHTVGEDYQTTFDKLSKGEVKPYQRDDKNILDRAKKGIDKIFNNGYAKIFYKNLEKNYPNIAVDTMHNHGGICGFTEQYTKSQIPYWYRDLTKKKPVIKKKPKETPIT
jgi:hypothetical protein